MSEAEIELVNYPVYANSPADELKLRIFWVVEDEMVPIEVG